jgi:hypothetical protein
MKALKNGSARPKIQHGNFLCKTGYILIPRSHAEGRFILFSIFRIHFLGNFVMYNRRGTRHRALMGMGYHAMNWYCDLMGTVRRAPTG